LKDNVLIGLVAIVAGVVVIAWNDALQWVIGILLIVWGILSLLGRK